MITGLISSPKASDNLIEGVNLIFSSFSIFFSGIVKLIIIGLDACINSWTKNKSA